jgi:hypothetical protein
MEINEQRLRNAIRAVIYKKYGTKFLKESKSLIKLLELKGDLSIEDTTSLVQGKGVQMGEGDTSYAIMQLNDLFGKIIGADNSSGTQLESMYMSLPKPEYRKSFVKHVIQGYYDFLAPKLTSMMPLESILERFPQRREEFIQKQKNTGIKVTENKMLQEFEMKNPPLKWKLEADGLPQAGEEPDEKDLEKERKEEEKKEEEANLGDPGTEDFPGEHHLSGEHSFGRRDAWKFISNSKKQVVEAIDSVKETEDEKQRREAEGDQSPLEEFLEFFFINMILHCWKLENKHFNSSFDDVEEFFSEVASSASYQKVDIGDAIQSEEEAGEEPEIGEPGEEGLEGLDLEEPSEEDELNLSV